MIDYEKEYKEMVQRVKELHESGSPLTKRQMEIICPGLAESEDERIRLWVKTHLQLIDSPDDLEDYKKAFDWIERQKEPKPHTEEHLRKMKDSLAGVRKARESFPATIKGRSEDIPF